MNFESSSDKSVAVENNLSKKSLINDLLVSKGYIKFPQFFSKDQITDIIKFVTIEKKRFFLIEDTISVNTSIEVSREHGLGSPNNVGNNEKQPRLFQHLHLKLGLEFIKEIGDYINQYFKLNGTVVNMLLFIKHPDPSSVNTSSSPNNEGHHTITQPHQDGAHFGRSDNYITFWIPLSNVNTENSCLHYLNDSHKGGILPHEFDRVELSLVYDNVPLDKFTPVEMNVGDMICHHPYTLHYSNINKTNEVRYAIGCIIRL